MMIKKITAVLLLTALLLAGCASCATASKEDLEQTLIAETVQPLSPEALENYLDDPNALGKVMALQTTFDEMEESAGSDFTVTVEDGRATVVAYRGDAVSVRLPQEIDGNPVVAIADGAFDGESQLKELYLPDSLSEIGEGILKDCKSLEALRTPLLGHRASETQFLGYLFGGKTHETNSSAVPATLAYLELGGTLSALSDYALFDCNDLVCLTLPESMTSIGFYSLFNCTSLLAVNLDGLTQVSTHALDSCSALTLLIFGEELTEIGLGALEGCTELRTLVLPFVGGSADANTYLGYLFGASVPDHAKDSYPRYLNTVELLEGCTSLGDYAFYNCETLTNVYLPDSLQTVGVRAFAGCERLSALTLSASVTEIRENAFFGCISLASLIFEENSSLTELGVNAFYNCSALTEMTLPQSLRTLPASCFANCLSLGTVNLGGVTTVGKNAFRHCQSLTEITAQPNIVLESGNGFAERILYPKEEK